MTGFYRPPPPKSASKASASTVCQKCLKRDIYECKAEAQARPYIARPSRTQQLFNPKLVPKLTNDAPNDLLRKKGIADEQLAQLDADRRRDRSHSPAAHGASGTTRRARSRSVLSDASSSSVSTVSTNRSRTHSSPRETQPHNDAYMISQSHSQSHHDMRDEPEYHSSGKRRRSPSAEARSTSDDDRNRNTRMRRNVRSPEQRGRGRDRLSRSRERDTRSRSHSNGRRTRILRPQSPRAPQSRSQSPHAEGRFRDATRYHARDRSDRREASPRRARPPPRERSLSPFSKRLALTQAMGRGRG